MYIDYLKKNYNTMRAIRDALRVKNGKTLQSILIISELYEESEHRNVARLIHCLEDLYALVKVIIPSTYNSTVVKNCLLRLLNDETVLNKLFTNVSDTILSMHLTLARKELVIDVLLTLPHTVPYFFHTVYQVVDIFAEIANRADPRAKAALMEIYRSPKIKILFSNKDEFLDKVFNRIHPEFKNVVLEMVNASNHLDQKLGLLEQDLINPSNDTQWSGNEKEEIVSWLRRR